MNVRILRTALACGAALVAVGVHGNAFAQKAPAADGAEAGDGSEIVVTAQKRSERLSDVPAAVTAVTSDTLQAAGAVSIRDLSATVPGLQIAGGIGSGSLTIRGITSGNDGNSTVGLQIDGAPVGPWSRRLQGFESGFFGGKTHGKSCRALSTEPRLAVRRFPASE